MFRAAEYFCHAVRKNLKFKLLYFQNEECYPAENKQDDWNLYFLLCDEDKNPKLRIVMNFSFLWRHVKTKNWIRLTHSSCIDNEQPFFAVHSAVSLRR